MGKKTLRITPLGAFTVNPTGQVKRYSLNEQNTQLLSSSLRSLTQNDPPAKFKQATDFIVAALQHALDGQDEQVQRYSRLSEQSTPPVTLHDAEHSLALLNAQRAAKLYLQGEVPVPLSRETLTRYARQVSEAEQVSQGSQHAQSALITAAFKQLRGAYERALLNQDGTEQARLAAKQAAPLTAEWAEVFREPYEGLMSHFAARRGVLSTPQVLARYARENADEPQPINPLSTRDVIADEHARKANESLVDAREYLSEKHFGAAYLKTKEAHAHLLQAQKINSEHPDIRGSMRGTSQALEGMRQTISRAARDHHVMQMQNARRENTIKGNHMNHAHRELVEGIDAATNSPQGSPNSVQLRCNCALEHHRNAIMCGAPSDGLHQTQETVSLIQQLAADRFKK